jgi:hypothetical protein
MQTMTALPPKGVGFKESGSRPAHNPVKEFGRHILNPEAVGVKLNCAAGAIHINHDKTNSFRLVRKESIPLELAFPKRSNIGPWNVAHDPATNAAIWSVSVLVGQLDSDVYPTTQSLSVMTGQNAIKGAIKYGLNCYAQQLLMEDYGTEPYFRTKDKIDLINAVCLTDSNIDKAHATAQYAFRIPPSYGLVSEIALQLALNYAVYENKPPEFWVNATEFRPGATRVASHSTADYIIHAHQIAISTEIKY